MKLRLGRDGATTQLGTLTMMASSTRTPDTTTVEVAVVFSSEEKVNDSGFGKRPRSQVTVTMEESEIEPFVARLTQTLQTARLLRKVHELDDLFREATGS